MSTPHVVNRAIASANVRRLVLLENTVHTLICENHDIFGGDG